MSVGLCRRHQSFCGWRTLSRLTSRRSQPPLPLRLQSPPRVGGGSAFVVRLHCALMKFIILSFALLLFHPSAHADGIPRYSWCRDWIDKHCATNTPTKDQSVYVGHDATPEYASAIRFHQGIGLREIIDQTPYKKGTATIWIMHQHPKEREPSGEFITVKPSDTPKFEVRESDIIWIWIYEDAA